ncbi:protein angel homolog 1 [Melanotaenia boesemani]|uniref:protein angel homolog 1 n=1 Tax=Melanotaenia boesemani TaxID=1250792 RepID=UPI001C0524B3|nr:protein angel homolog 1 [Melanotaenia boesemani]
MIGSLLFYALYPLSQYFTSRPSGGTKKGLSPAVVNGTAVWNGDAVTVRFAKSQTPLLDQWEETKGETKERVKVQDREQDSNTKPNTNKEPLTADLLEAKKNNPALKMSLVHSALQEAVEALKHVNGEVSPLEKNMQETTCAVQEQIQIQTLDVSVTPPKDSMNNRSAEEQLKTPNMKESQTPAKTTSQVSECWDEYVITVANATSDGLGSSETVFASLLANTENHLKLDKQHNRQTGWHFPVGPGLSQEVQCPLWHFPAASYYPQMQSTMPFEVMWRVWDELEEGAAEAEPSLIPFPFKKASIVFTVMSYNILAQDLLELNHQLYIHCPPEVLDWSHRCSLLLEEINKWAPDILCLQEVQENHYKNKLHPVLSQMGYTCVYKRRTGTKTDGCAICYRSSCFSEVTVTKLEFFRPETKLLDRHNVGIVLLLRPVVTQGAEGKDKGPLLCVANTHLLFNPRRGDVKLAQLAIMLAEIDTVVKSYKAKGEHCNVILCGDFNSLPHTPLYQLITTSKLYFQGLPAWMISGQEDLSYKPTCYRLFAPLWSRSLGITDTCRYTTVSNVFERRNKKSGKCKYSHDFMLQLRYCPAACVRPQDLELIPGVTDNTPDLSSEDEHFDKRFSQSFRHTIRHHLDLESVYKHVLPGSGAPEITTLHSEGGATVDYIFYSPKRTVASKEKADGEFASEGLELIGSLSLLSEDVLWSMNGLPNHIFPSDHLSLIARFQLDFIH